MFKKVLIANRGEIAVRVIRACREMGIATTAIYSDGDRGALHVRLADEALHIGPTQPSQSYLNIGRILDAAARARCDAVHPGYGFLAENAAFARACADAKVTFIGPSATSIERMGDKLAARAQASKAGVPVVPGVLEAVRSVAQAREIAQKLGYPVALKASAGGGGKGLKVAASEAELEPAMSLAAKEAAAYFGDPTLYVERYLRNPKHVEVQILADRHGHVVHLGERDCSLQRRHQKLVEETPAPIDAALRSRMHEAAVRLARAIEYDSAGTIECLVEGNEFFFLEMNTRIQVEHTITEAVYGFDLVKAQIRIAAGEPLWFGQSDLHARGQAIECRINAESPANGFAPCPGRIADYHEPGGPGIRIDSAAFSGWVIGSDYDSLIAKLIAWGSDRSEARERMVRALWEYSMSGVETTIPFYQLLLATPEFSSGAYTTFTVDRFVQEHRAALTSAYQAEPNLPDSAWADGLAGGDGVPVTVEVNDRQYRVRVFGLPATAGALPSTRRYVDAKRVAHGGASIASPMHGILAEIRVAVGDSVAAGQVVAIIEAMKMMNEVTAHRPGTVTAVAAKVGDTVESGAALVVLEEDTTA